MRVDSRVGRSAGSIPNLRGSTHGDTIAFVFCGVRSRITDHSCTIDVRRVGSMVGLSTGSIQPQGEYADDTLNLTVGA